MPIELLESARDALPLLRRDRAMVAVANALRGAEALEPGGPSMLLFGPLGLVPVYSRLAALDTLDYSEQTIWSAGAKLPRSYRRSLIGEARRIESVLDSSYDAVLASHVIEHIANPIGALREWVRVVRPGGHVLLVVPHRDGTFDHRRPRTSIEHLIRDAELDSGEDDRTHLEEVLALHDLSRDPGAESRESFERRCQENLSTRAMHHHVFDSRLVVEMCRAAGLEVLAIRAKRPFHIVCLARVGGDRAEPGREQPGDEQLATALASSPFASDRGSA
jgi:SAM-dependent methyltransferase